MRLIKPSVEITAMTDDPLKRIEIAGRVCYKSEDKMTEDSAANFVRMLIKRGHESVIEHASATVKFICDRGVSHELVRHRIASFSQESSRYCNYSGKVTFVIPPWVTTTPREVNKYEDVLKTKAGADFSWLMHMLNSASRYKQFLKLGWKPEQARAILPNSLKTELIMTANFREWRHFLKLRASAAAHPQMRELAIPLLQQFQTAVPVVFDDIPVLIQKGHEK